MHISFFTIVKYRVFKQEAFIIYQEGQSINTQPNNNKHIIKVLRATLLLVN